MANTVLVTDQMHSNECRLLQQQGSVCYSNSEWYTSKYWEIFQQQQDRERYSKFPHLPGAVAGSMDWLIHPKCVTTADGSLQFRGIDVDPRDF